MGNQCGASWRQVLPWVLLSRRTSYHSELGATPAQLVFGSNPRVPGELKYPMGSETTIEELLKTVMDNITRPPAQTALHKQTKIYMPPATKTCTHVWAKKQKRKPLDPVYDGPWKILERMGDSSLKLKVGHYADGRPRTEIRHWRSCQPVQAEEIPDVSRPALGRPQKESPPFNDFSSP